MLRAEQHLLACANEARAVGREQVALQPIEDSMLKERSNSFRAEVVQLMELADPEAEAFSIESCKAQLKTVEAAYDEVKAALLNAGAELRTPIPGVIDILDQNNRIRRMARQMVKAMRDLNELYTSTKVKASEPAEVANQPQ